MTRLKIRKNYLIACFSFLYILIPIAKLRLVYLAVVLFSFVLVNGLSFKRIFYMDNFRLIYAFTFLASYFIHFYSDSILNSLIFIFTFFIVRSILLEGLKSEKEIERYLDFVLVIFTGYAILGIIESFTAFNLFDYIFDRDVLSNYGANEWRGGIYRNHGICTVSINNSMIVLMVWLIASYKAYKSRSIFYLAAYCIIGLDFFFIFSRLTILIGAFLQVLIILKLKGRGKLRFWILAIIATVTLTLILPDQLKSLSKQFNTYFLPIVEEFFGGQFKNNNGINHAGSGQRLALWGWVFAFVKNNLLLGVGFVTKFFHTFNDSGIIKIKESVEVQWLYVLLQKGLFGLSGFICFQIQCLRSTINSYKLGRTQLKTPNIPQIFLFMTIGYFMSLFGCAGFEDLLFYYMMFAVFEAYEKVNGIVGA